MGKMWRRGPAMKNFGLSKLILIAPKFEWPNDRAQMLASPGRHTGKQLNSIPPPPRRSPFNLVLATTARDRDIRRKSTP
jgi:tRNA C32,U32 (ribose-2'-O)-methylase TrmJ